MMNIYVCGFIYFVSFFALICVKEKTFVLFCTDENFSDNWDSSQLHVQIPPNYYFIKAPMNAFVRNKIECAHIKNDTIRLYSSNIELVMGNGRQAGA